MLETSIEEVLRPSISEVLEASIVEVLRPSIAEVVLGMIGIISYQGSPGRCRDRPGQILPSRFSPNSARSQIHKIHIQGKRHHVHIQKILVWETLFFLHRCTLCTVTYKKCTGDVWQVAVSRLRICLIACSFLCLFVWCCCLCTVQKVHCHCTGDVWRVAVSRLPRIPRAQKQKPPQHFSLHAMIH